MLGDGVCSNAAVIRVFRARVRELGITFDTVDDISGLTRGYTGKCLSDPPARDMGTEALWAIAGALGISFVPIIDHRQTAAVQGRWVKRKRAPVACSALQCVSQVSAMRFSPDHGEALTNRAGDDQAGGSSPERAGGCGG